MLGVFTQPPLRSPCGLADVGATLVVAPPPPGSRGSVQRERAADDDAVVVGVRRAAERGVDAEAVGDRIAEAGREARLALEVAERDGNRGFARARIVMQARGGERERGAGARLGEVGVDLALQRG